MYVSEFQFVKILGITDSKEVDERQKNNFSSFLSLTLSPSFGKIFKVKFPKSNLNVKKIQLEFSSSNFS